MKIRNEDKQIVIIATVMIALLVTLPSLTKMVNGQMMETSLSEDQALFCIRDTWTEDFTAQGNEKVACMIIDDLDLLNDAQEKYLYGRFQAELDTFNFSDASGVID